MKRGAEDDVCEAKRPAKHVRQDHQRKLRLVRTARCLEDHISIPDIRTLICDYANEFDGVLVMARDQHPPDVGWYFSVITVWLGCLVSTSHHRAVVWDLDARAPKLELVGHTAAISSFALLADDKLASGSSDSTIRVWSKDGSCVLTIAGHTKRVLDLAVLDTGHLVSRSDDLSLGVWDTTNGTRIHQINYVMGGKLIACLPRGILASVPFGGAMLDVFDVTAKTRLQSIEVKDIVCLTALPDGRLASGTRRGQVRLWNAAQGTFWTMARGHTEAVTALAACGQLLAAGSMDQTVCVWHTARLVCLFKLAGHSDQISALAFLPDGKLVSSARDETIRGWDVSTGRCALTLNTKYAISRMEVLPDCKLAGICYGGMVDTTVLVWA